MREHDRQRHELFGLGAGEPEHQALVAGAAGIDAHGDVRRLAVNRREDGARLRIEAVLAAVVADIVDGGARHFLNVDERAGRDLAGDDDEAGGDQRLARHAADRIPRQDRIENGIGNLIGDFVGVAFGD